MITEFTYPSELSEEDVLIDVLEYTPYHAGNRDEPTIHESIEFRVWVCGIPFGSELCVSKSEYDEILEIFKARNNIN